MRCSNTLPRAHTVYSKFPLLAFMMAMFSMNFPRQVKIDGKVSFASDVDAISERTTNSLRCRELVTSLMVTMALRTPVGPILRLA
jgi:hypothetical protein